MLESQDLTAQKSEPFQSPVGRALLVVNAKARQGREYFRQALEELQKQEIHLVEAHAVTRPRFIVPLVEHLIEKEKPDTVIVGGGDGTISALADLLAHRKIRLGVLPMGTANDFARNLKLEADVVKAVQVIKDGYTLPVDLGCGGDRYFLNVASIGLGVKVAGLMDENLKKAIGPLAYGAAAFRALQQIRPVHVRLVFKDRPVGDGFQEDSFKALQIGVANGRFYGGGMVSAPNVTITDNSLTVTVIEDMRPVELLALLPGMLNGSYVGHPKVHRYKTTDVLVETARPHRVNMDGEVCQRTPLRFKVAPAALNVLAPRP